MSETPANAKILKATDLEGRTIGCAPGIQSISPTRSEGGSERTKSSLYSISSSSSTGDASITSTIRYDAEPFEVYRKRIEKLCEMLWPPTKTFKTRVSNCQITSRLRATRFLRKIAPSPQIPTLERLKGGDYNRITAITLLSSYHERPRELIVRVPRVVKEARPDRSVAFLAYLHRTTSIPLPFVVAKDFTSHNPLEGPYVIQQRIHGSSVDTMWDSLNHVQRCTFAKELGKVVRILLSIENPLTGIVDVPLKDAEGIGGLKIIPFELKEGYAKIDAEESMHAPSSVASHEPQTTLQVLISNIKRWKKYDSERCVSDYKPKLWDTMKKVVQEMNSLSLFPSGLNCLCHVDLHRRNVMAQTLRDGTLQIKGILDWDEAIFAPKFMACEPPRWLWDTTDFECDEDGLCPWPYEIAGAKEVPATQEQQELKRVFESHAGSSYPSLAYEACSRFSRALFRVAQFGLDEGRGCKTVERIAGEWEVLRRDLTNGVE